MARPECDTPPLVNLWQGVHFGFWNMLEKYTCTCGNIPRDIGITFICTETCDVHVKSLTTNKQWSLLIWALLSDWAFLKQTGPDTKVSISWLRRNPCWYNDIYQSHEKATLLWFPNPIIHSFKIHFSTFHGCKKLSLPCRVNEMQFLKFRFASQIGDHL